ncbi:MerR family transcriptional regulator [Granulicella cerasi]|uniref:MerR family transcriptional regulator n=1 Tax=Granulicella cerasi TaxID=741063 RepID=A0ABW1Z856_9BACT|nr:MerR family transcriptional regulator [Granulicella cerasi]
MATHHPIRKQVTPATPEIPDKLYFRIGDVAKLCQVPAYVLRFWETEFPQLKPNKGGTGQRLYRRKDVEMALRIKGLLYDQGYTIAGARQAFKNDARVAETAMAPAPSPIASAEPVAVTAPVVPAAPKTPITDLDRLRALTALRDEMRELVKMLSKPVGPAASESKVQAMRPRLVLEKPVAPKLEPVLKPRLLAQADLFGGFGNDDDPVAS